MTIEQRKELRLIPHDHTTVVLRPHFAKLGNLIDINKGGLSFQYIANEGKAEVSTHLDLFTNNSEFYLPSLPCKVAYDIGLPRNNTTLASLEYRRCGLEFGEFTQEQAARLELYLEKHTAGTV
ncbi:hypothetical protein KKG29_05005 [Patescibacteria group bacterium]|nr:hypothetical protein [Patescibacteria group bacterium]MBU4388388.1 hypothetical protein [Pseudomonadota bacterium]